VARIAEYDYFQVPQMWNYLGMKQDTRLHLGEFRPRNLHQKFTINNLKKG